MMIEVAYLILAIPHLSLHSRAQCREVLREIFSSLNQRYQSGNFASGANGELKLPGEMLEQTLHTSLTEHLTSYIDNLVCSLNPISTTGERTLKM